MLVNIHSVIFGGVLQQTQPLSSPLSSQAETQQQQWLLGAAGRLGQCGRSLRVWVFRLRRSRPLFRRRWPIRGRGLSAETPHHAGPADSLHRPAWPHPPHRHKLRLSATLPPLRPAQGGLWLRGPGGESLHGARAPLALRIPLSLFCLPLAALGSFPPEETQPRGRSGPPGPGQTLHGGDAADRRLAQLSVGAGLTRESDSSWQEQRQTGGVCNIRYLCLS